MAVAICTIATGAAAAVRLPTGQLLTPTAALGSRLQRLPTGLRADGSADADGAVTTVVSPDGTALLVLTTGYDSSYLSTAGKAIVHDVLDPVSGLATNVTTPGAQWIFVYDIRSGRPKLVHALWVPFAYDGIAWDPQGRRFYVSGGPEDRVYIFKAARGPAVSADQTWLPDAPSIELGHNTKPNAPLSTQDGGLLKHTPAAGPRATAQGLPFPAVAAGIATSADGRTLYVANMQNDSLSVVDVASRRAVREIRLFTPGGRVARGEYPFWIAVGKTKAGSTPIYVSSLRDGQVVVMGRGGERYIRVGGAPNKMLLSADGSALYVANGDADAVDVIDTATATLARTISLSRPGDPYLGANPNALALDPAGKTLYVTLGGENAVALVNLASGTVMGRIPTGWYPSSVSVSPDGRTLYVVNTKSPAGPTAYSIDDADNPLPLPDGANGYVYNLEKAGLLTLRVPDASQLAALSAMVDRNNGFGQSVPAGDAQMMAFLHAHIKHVIFVMKENRTYDQVLGDLRPGNGDPRLVQFGRPLTPNNHALASQFVTLDDFFASGDVSGDGWSWTLQARANDYNAKTVAFDYGNGGFTTEWQGEPRNINMSLPVFGPHTPSAVRITTLFDPSGGSTILPGDKDIGATEGAGDLDRGARGGFIWDAVLRAGLTLRHYGMYTSLLFYNRKAPYYLRTSRTPYASHLIQAIPVQRELWGRTDLYYRGWDLDVPDQYRFEEWKREFDGYVRRSDLPSFEAVDLPTDHFGNFGTNVGGLNTPESQIAGNDYALGELVAAVSDSPYWKNTAIFVVEDDAQDGPDHVDSHRTIAQVISAYTRRHAVDSTFYTTVSMIRTMEDILGIDHLGIFDANARPMADAFERQADMRPYRPIVPGILCRSPAHADLVAACADARTEKSAAVRPLRDARWWRAATSGFDFQKPDAVDAVTFDRILWLGTEGAR